MAEYLTRDSVETVSLNSPIQFLDSIPCPNGNVYHQSGTGIFILRGRVNNPTCCFARYRVTFTGNISIPTDGDVTPIAVAIAVSGEEREGSRAIYTPAAVDEYGNVTATASVTVPKGCCFTVSVDYVDATTLDPTITPTPTINVVNGSLNIERTA